MSKFVIHKKGFFYTDEAFEAVEEAKGTMLGTYASLEEAQTAKAAADINSMCGLATYNAVDFFFYKENYEEIQQHLAQFYNTEFGLSIEDKHYFNFPDRISQEQAKKFLEILGLSFHDIVEYPEEQELNPDDFNLDFEELGEF